MCKKISFINFVLNFDNFMFIQQMENIFWNLSESVLQVLNQFKCWTSLTLFKHLISSVQKPTFDCYEIYCYLISKNLTTEYKYSLHSKWEPFERFHFCCFSSKWKYMLIHYCCGPVWWLMIFREPTKRLSVAREQALRTARPYKQVQYRSCFIQSLAQPAEYNRYVPKLPLYQDSLADRTTKIGMYAVFVLKDNKI